MPATPFLAVCFPNMKHSYKKPPLKCICRCKDLFSAKHRALVCAGNGDRSVCLATVYTIAGDVSVIKSPKPGGTLDRAIDTESGCPLY